MNTIKVDNPNDRDNIRRIFTALAAAELIWDYADRILRYCAAAKISELAKVSREVKAVRAHYDSNLTHNFCARSREVLAMACQQFKQEYRRDLTIMFCTVSNEMGRKYAGQHIPHKDMRVYASCCITLIHALRAIPNMPCIPELDELGRIMVRYVTPYELDITRNVDLCRTILAQRLAEAPDMECEV